MLHKARNSLIRYPVVLACSTQVAQRTLFSMLLKICRETDLEQVCPALDKDMDCRGPDDPRCAMRELEQRGRSLRNEFEP